MGIRERIAKADVRRRRTADFTLGGETFAVEVAIYSAADYRGFVERFSQASDADNAAFLANQFFDPESGENLFTADDILAFSMATVIDLIRFFAAVNSGSLEKKS